MSPVASICKANIAAFNAPFIATVATGIPGGICIIANAASIPSNDALIGTPITGKGVIAAITPGKCAAIPAAAIITSMPLLCALVANSSTSFGVRWADKALISKGISIWSKNFAALSITGKSEVDPIIILTLAFILVS